MWNEMRELVGIVIELYISHMSKKGSYPSLVEDKAIIQIRICVLISVDPYHLQYPLPPKICFSTNNVHPS